MITSNNKMKMKKPNLNLRNKKWSSVMNSRDFKSTDLQHMSNSILNPDTD